MGWPMCDLYDAAAIVRVLAMRLAAASRNPFESVNWCSGMS